MDLPGAGLLGGGALARLGVARTAAAAALVGWVPALVLGVGGWALGHGVDPVLLAPKTHVRWLFAAPLLLAFVVALAHDVDRVLPGVRDGGFVRPEDRPRLDRLVASTSAWVRRPGPDVALFLVAMAASAPAGWAARPGADAWTAMVGAGLFRWIALLALERWLLWATLLWRLARLGVEPSPLHPDGAGGLQLLALPSRRLALAALAFGSLVASSFWGVVQRHGAGLPELRNVVGAYTAGVLLLGLGPLLSLLPALLEARRRAVVEHGGFGQRYVRAFEARWLGPDAPDPLGTPDIQSLADAQTAVTQALRLGLLPFGRNEVAVLVVASLLPFLPVLLTLVPVTQVVTWVAGALT